MHRTYLGTQVVVAGLILDGDPADFLEAWDGVHGDCAGHVYAGQGAGVGREGHGVGRVRVIVAGRAPREGGPRRRRRQREDAGEE